MFTPHPFIRLFFCLLLLGFGSLLSLAQTFDETPVYITARLFQATAPVGRDISDQLFRLRTAAQEDDDQKWIANVKKAYPDFDISLLQVHQFRSYHKPKPYVIALGDLLQPHLEIQVLTAYGLAADDKVITNAIIAADLYPSTKNTNAIPTALCNQGFEAQKGMTFFYSRQELGLPPEMYAKFLREGTVVPKFQREAHYLIIAFSFEPEDHPKQTFETKASAELQAQATKKVQPVWPAEIQAQRLAGRVMVKVEIGTEGKVTRAGIWRSTLPEGNAQAVEAARQWEFPVTALTDKKAPITAYLTFTVEAPPPAPETSATPEAAPATAKPIAEPKAVPAKKTVSRKK